MDCSEVNSFLRFTIEGCTGTGEAVATDGAVVDSFVIDGCERDGG